MGRKERLISLHGILDEESRERIRALCLTEDDPRLSDHFFRYPLHMSLKRSFRCDEFDEVKKDLEEILNGCGKFDCGALHPVRISDMLWLCPERDEKLKRIHEEIDLFLSDKYQIPIDGYDMVYQPHVTVFRDEDDGKLDEMYRRLSILEPVNAAIDEVILSQGERNHRFGL